MWIMGRWFKFRTRIVVLTSFIVLTLYSFNFPILLHANLSESEPKKTELPFAVVHVDLKGAPPTLTYLKSILQKLQELGTKGLLMEYEDMFPYTGILANLSSPHHYNAHDLKKFLSYAHDKGFEIIPLVQTFSHMQFVLKLEEFKILRENPVYPDSICPTRNGSKDLIREILRQVIQFHQTIVPLKHIHVGCDEVTQINRCKYCKSRKLNESTIYLEHIRMVAEIVRGYSPKSTVLIWDDMMRSIVKPNDWQTIPPFDNVEPVWWAYSKKVKISHSTLRFYHQKFKNIWIASAFKGADGKNAIIPELSTRFENHLSWINIIRDYKFGGEHHTFKFKGFILTGWSRYDHFAPLCELLPVGLPSLILNLKLIQNFPTNLTIPSKLQSKDIVSVYYNYIKDDFHKSLECPVKSKSSMDDFTGCRFNGSFPLYDDIKRYINFTERIISLHSKFNYFNILTKKMCKQEHEKLTFLENNVKRGLKLMYDEHVCKEFIDNISYRADKVLTRCIGTKSNV